MAAVDVISFNTPSPEPEAEPAGICQHPGPDRGGHQASLFLALLRLSSAVFSCGFCTGFGLSFSLFRLSVPKNLIPATNKLLRSTCVYRVPGHRFQSQFSVTKNINVNQTKMQGSVDFVKSEQEFYARVAATSDSTIVASSTTRVIPNLNFFPTDTNRILAIDTASQTFS